MFLLPGRPEDELKRQTSSRTAARAGPLAPRSSTRRDPAVGELPRAPSSSGRRTAPSAAPESSAPRTRQVSADAAPAPAQPPRRAGAPARMSSSRRAPMAGEIPGGSTSKSSTAARFVKSINSPVIKGIQHQTRLIRGSVKLIWRMGKSRGGQMDQVNKVGAEEGRWTR